MNPEEARLNLDACTLRPGDAEEEARLLAQEDAELGAWLEKRTAQDEKMAAVYHETEVPKGLNDRLLAAMLAEVQAGAEETASESEPEAGPEFARPQPMVSTRPALMPWLALAAVVVLSAAGFWWKVQQPPVWQKEALGIAQSLSAGTLPLDVESADYAKLKAVLAKTTAPQPENLPGDLVALSTLGCKVIQIEGREASVVCFMLTPDQPAHLITFKVKDLPNAPAEGSPQYVSREGWHVATWRVGDQGYFLATQADEANLKGLFAMLRQAGYWGRLV